MTLFYFFHTKILYADQRGTGITPGLIKLGGGVPLSQLAVFDTNRTNC